MYMDQWHTLVMRYCVWTSGTPVAPSGDALLCMDQWHTLVMRYCVWTSGTPVAHSGDALLKLEVA
jgi:uncharacterized Zn-binding protein involved in type VI secretion